MKIKNLISVIFLYASIAYGGGPDLEFCNASQKGWSLDSCITPCTDLVVNGAYTGGNLSDGSVGFCYGQATTYRFTIYRIDIALSTGNNSHRCTIFNGAATVDTGNASPGVTILQGDLNFQKCSAHDEGYDRIYFYYSRKIEYAGYTNYPDSSGKIARTTSFCSADSLGGVITNLSWLEDMAGGTFSDNSRCYVRESNTWNTTYKKAANAPSTTDFSNSSNVLMYFDDYKISFLNSLNGPPYTAASSSNTDDGFYLEYDGTASGNLKYGTKLDSNDRLIWRLTGSDFLSLGKLDKSKTQRLTISYYGSARSISSQQYGLRFYFRRNGTTAEFIGTNPSSNGLFITLDQF